jgi:hypothetical protein
MGPNRVVVFLPSPEDGNRSSFRNVVFSSYLEFRTIDKVQIPSNPKDFKQRSSISDQVPTAGCTISIQLLTKPMQMFLVLLNSAVTVRYLLQGSYGIVKLAYNEEDDTHYVST